MRQSICKKIGFAFYLSSLEPKVKMGCQKYQDMDKVHQVRILALSCIENMNYGHVIPNHLNQVTPPLMVKKSSCDDDRDQLLHSNGKMLEACRPLKMEPLAAPESFTTEASETRVNWDYMETPFQTSANRNHQVMSALAAVFRRMWWLGWLPMDCRTCSWRMKLHPGRMTLVANCNSPVKLWRTCLVTTLWERHWDRVSLSLKNLLARRCRCKVTVSTSMPRNVRQVAGPSNLDISRGTPRCEHVETNLDFRPVASSSDVATKIKSSR